jgi:hypothetical protein
MILSESKNQVISKKNELNSELSDLWYELDYKKNQELQFELKNRELQQQLDLE